MKSNLCRLMLTVLGCLLLSSLASATPILINPGPGLAANPDALAAFNRAAANWGRIFSDPVTVNIDADFQNMGSASILGSTSSVMLAGSYNFIRDQMVADGIADPNDAILASVPTASQFSAFVPAGFGLNGLMAATKADLKAMGFAGLDNAFGWSDASITFNSEFGFDYDNSDGVGPGLYDFESVAMHEIGHVLGFVSVVDTVDYYLSQGQTIDAYVYPLDLFRFDSSLMPNNASEFTNYPRSLLPGYASYFSDTTHEWAFSTGRFTGDGRQASHWKDDSLSGTYIGIMDPTLASGTIEHITDADIRALDVIGWDVAAPQVPEPGTLILTSLGLVGLFLGNRRWSRKS